MELCAPDTRREPPHRKRPWHTSTIEPNPARTRREHIPLIAIRGRLAHALTARCSSAPTSGDQHARAQLVDRFLPLARQLARRYQRGGEPLDDLIQVASLGLLKAIDRFDPEPRDRVLELRRADHPR